MADKLEKLKKTRAVVRGLVTKLNNKIDTELERDEDETVTKQQKFAILEDFIDQLNEKLVNLNKLNHDISENMTLDENFEAEILSAEEINEKIISYRSRIKTKIGEMKNVDSMIALSVTNGMNAEVSMNSENSSRTTLETKVAIKLPKLSIGKFFGDSICWLEFWQQYEAAVHENTDLTKLDKFNYLKSLLGGVASNAIQGLKLTNENYDTAIDLLKSRFGRNDVIINAHVNKLLNLTPVKNPRDILGLRKLYDDCEIQIRNLESLNVTSGSYGHLLCPILMKLLPESIVFDYNRTRKDQNDFDVRELINFLKTEVQCREASHMLSNSNNFDSTSRSNKTVTQDKFQYSGLKEKRIKNLIPTAATLATGSESFGTLPNKSIERKVSCVFCDKSTHYAVECKYAQGLPLEQRRQILMKKGVCFRCLRLNHIASQCLSKVKCIKCKRYHHFLLCPNSPKPNFEEKRDECSTNQDETLANITTTPQVLLQTLRVVIRNGEEKMNVRAIFDSASQRSYILNSTAHKLGYQSLRKENLRHSLFGGTNTNVCQHDVYKAYLSNLSGTYNCNFDVLGQEKICDSMPPIAQGIWINEIMEYEIDLTDDLRGPIEIMIGADVAGKLMTGGFRKLPSGLTAIETKLGWTVMGRTKEANTDDSTDLIVTSMLATNTQMADLWKLDVLGITDPAEKQTKKEQEEAAKEYFLKTVKRLPDDRYEVSLPWIQGHKPLINNKWMAERRLKTTVRILKSKNLLKEYEEVFREWLMEGVIEPVDLSKIDELSCMYLPHRAVIKEHSTTKIRPVFDASAKQKNSPSLNDCLEKGPNLLELIPSMLNKFRLREFGVTADIRKAFLQISINEKERDYLRFLWLEDGNPENLRIYRHKRVVFGINASPFLLGATISYHLENVPLHLREVADKLKNSMYVDNCVISLDTKEEVEFFIEKSKEILSSAKFDLRGWRYTEREIRTDKTKENVSVLGLEWDTFEDTLCCNVKDDAFILEMPVTKRSILKSTNQVFDPLGLISPVILNIKLIIQDCWKIKLSWDDELPDELCKKYLKWKKDIVKIDEIKVPRRLSHNLNSKLSFHVFCDASKSAYATCVYLRSESSDGILCQLVQSRSKVAPLKSLTISRLELLACTIGVRLMKTIKEDLQLENIPTFYWTDSMNALHWIRNEEQWGIFVMNRVEEIRKYTKSHEWNHVPGALNPSDLPSRGCSIETLKSKNWHEGPLWLKQDQRSWPVEQISPDEEIINSEKIKTVISSMITTEEDFSYFTKISSFEKIIRITAWIRRFVNNCKVSKNSRTQKDLTTEELKNAEITIWKIVQKNSFASTGDARLCHLRPFEDSHGIIRTKTQLLMRDDSENFRNPIILPSDHVIVEKFIMHKHILSSHYGVQNLMSILREDFWILRSRKTIRRILQKCIFCKRFEAKHPDVNPAPLPEDRVRDCAVYEITGIDLAGPLILKDGTKSWIVLFTCAVYRAIHLELITSLSTDKFLLSLRRFIARRGRPSTIYTDNGRNFVGANLALKKIDWEKVIKDTSLTRINWKFIPPASPWWGGFWERMVGLTKNILRKVLGRASLKYEELYTILCDCENVINSRPLTYISEDLELEPLTPAVFLRDIKESGVPDIDHIDATNLQKRWAYRTKVREDLRKRFRSEYLGQLKNCSKNSRRHRPLSLGDIVLIESSSKRLSWPLGKIIKLFPGKDGIVRLVKLQTKIGDVLRPVQRIYPLEVTCENGEDLRSTLNSTSVAQDDKKKEPEKAPDLPVNMDNDIDFTQPKVSRYGRLIRPTRR